MATCPKCRARYPDDVATCEVDGEALLPDEACATLDGDLRAGLLVGEYQIERKIGQGTFGTVYGAFHPVIGKAAAVKVLHRKFSSDSAVVSRFVAEARAVNRIRHRHIVDVFSFGTLEGGLQYFVMEWLEGVTFQQYLTQHGRLTPAQAIPILRDIGRALDAAHAAGIAHRDLKPENVFLCFDEEGTCFPKLLDFGIAKLLGDEAAHKTGTGVALGTPLYMSPEQCVGKGVDHRTDIYSFGAMTHQVLTGEPLFDAPSALEILMKHMSAEPLPVSQVFADLPPGLDAPVLHMLQKDPADRPESLRAAVDELAEAASAAGLDLSGPDRALTPPRSLRLTPEALAPGSPAADPRDASRAAAAGLAADAASGSAVAPGSAELADTFPAPPAEPPAALDDGGDGAAQAGSATASNLETEVDAPASMAEIRRSRTTSVLLGVAALLAGVVLTVVVMRSQTGDGGDSRLGSAAGLPAQAEDATVGADTASAPPASTSPPGDSSAREVRLTIRSNTSDVRVLRGDTEIGTSARPIALERSDQPIEITLKKSGYYPEVVTVTPNDDVVVERDLRRARAAPKPGPSGSGDVGEIAVPPGFDPP